MTREEILAMPAGRELDALVGGTVMGLDIVKEGRLPHMPKHYVPEFGRTIFTDVPHYSSSISAAWEVVEKMGPFAQLTAESYHGKTVWHASFSVVESVDAETAPLAICRAALLATMEETP